jgi:hypothetical protein
VFRAGPLLRVLAPHNQERAMADAAIPPEEDSTATPPKPEQTVCRRCGAPGPVGDEGFCDGCEKAMEQACL